MSQPSKAGEGAGAKQPPLSADNPGPGGWLSGLMWFVTLLMFVLLIWVVTQRVGPVLSANNAPTEEPLSDLPAQTEVKVNVPEFRLGESLDLPPLTRLANAHTVIPERNRESMTVYTVETGDSVFGISKEFDIKPETILWANEDQLHDNPNDLSVGQKLKIPAVDGVIYKWRKGDTIEGIAKKFKTTPEQILTWPDNNLDLGNPTIAPGAMVMVPGGSRELRTWVVPTIWRANAGANKSVNSQCDTSNTMIMGSGAFVWPTASHLISGNDYWSGHLGLDIGAVFSPVYAADGGVVVYAGGISGGYGSIVMIDHGNGFLTLYAHLSQINVRCGQGVSQGQQIAVSGNSGNSTGPHLHFEIRYLSSFVNPHDYIQ